MDPATTHVGMDLGIATFAAFSDGVLHPPLNAYRTHAVKKACMQRLLAGMVKYPQNWKKQQHRIARLDIRIANCRHDFLHKLSTETSKNHAVIGVEDLQVRHMSRSARGTVDEPGRNVAAKSGLNKAILDQGWGTFRRMLEYKQLWARGRGDCGPAALHLPGMSQVSPHLQREPSATSLVPLCGVWLCQSRGHCWCDQYRHPRLGAQGEVKRLLAPLGATGITVL